MQAKHAAKKAANIDNPAYVDPKLIRHDPKEQPSKSSKGAITCIDWSSDNSKIVVCFKQHNQVVVWDVVHTTQRILQIDYSVLERGH